MTRIAVMIVMAAAALAVTAGLARAESAYGPHDYWSRVERAQECAWGGGRAYAWGAPEYPCWNTAPRAGYGASPAPPGYGYAQPYPYGYAYPYQYPYSYGYGWR